MKQKAEYLVQRTSSPRAQLTAQLLFLELLHQAKAHTVKAHMPHWAHGMQHDQVPFAACRKKMPFLPCLAPVPSWQDAGMGSSDSGHISCHHHDLFSPIFPGWNSFYPSGAACLVPNFKQWLPWGGQGWQTLLSAFHTAAASSHVCYFPRL